MEILQIKYKHNTKDAAKDENEKENENEDGKNVSVANTDYNKDIKISKVSKLEWKIDEKVLLKMRSAIHLQCFISDMFDIINENYCIYIVPQGCSDIDKELDERTLEIIMVLFKMPHKISLIRYRYEIKNDFDDCVVEGVLQFYGYSEYKYWEFDDHNKFLSSNLDKIDHLTFYITIDIIAIYDDEYSEVPKAKWNQYGVIINDESE